jgi:hypothetical protein
MKRLYIGEEIFSLSKSEYVYLSQNPKNPILPLILPPKSLIFIYQTFFKGIHMCFQTELFFKI